MALFNGLSGVSPITEHVIVLKDDRPIKQLYYPKIPAMLKIVNAQVEGLLRNGYIEPLKSQCSIRVGWEEDRRDLDVCGISPAERAIDTRCLPASSDQLDLADTEEREIHQHPGPQKRILADLDGKTEPRVYGVHSTW